jgi:undecaprenyl-diphosphatase
MTLVTLLMLGLIQAVTEFVPISSDGHLALFQTIFGFTPSLSLTIFLNTATFVSVLWYFRRDFKEIFTNWPYLIVGSIPAGVVGLFFKDRIENLFSAPTFLPFFFLITASFLLATRFLPQKNQPLTLTKAFVIGIFQALALLPGVSRSGSTIFAALLLGLPLDLAFRFSFFLFLPASFGALLLDLKDTPLSTFLSPNYFITFVLTAIIGYFALLLLQRLVVSRRLWLFSLYLFGLSLLLFLVF